MHLPLAYIYSFLKDLVCSPVMVSTRLCSGLIRLRSIQAAQKDGAIVVSPRLQRYLLASPLAVLKSQLKHHQLDSAYFHPPFSKLFSPQSPSTVTF